MVFFFLMLALISALNLYLDYFNINALYSGLNAFGEIILMPLIFTPFIFMAFYHKLKSETAYSGVYLTVLIMGLSFYLFLVNLTPAFGAMVLLIAGFALAFAVFILPSGAAGPSEKMRGASEEGPRSNGGVFQRAETGAISRAAPGFSDAAALNFIMIFIAALIYIYSFYHISRSDTTFEFYSPGASLYHDAAAGYYARFNAPFANISINAGSGGASKIYGRKKFKLSPLPPREIILNDKMPASGFYINAAASDVKLAGDNLKSVIFDFPFLNILIDEKKAALISPRFVYKLEAGVNKDGSSVLKNYELAGDRFIMLDENNPYNKFGTQVKNFFAVSACASFAAIYDFSGNVRIIGASDSKTVMVVSGLKDFKSVANYGASDFLILCGASLFKVSVSSKAVDCLLAYDSNNGDSGGGFKELCTARIAATAVIARGDKSLVMLDGKSFKRLPPSIELNDSNRAVYYDGEILACCHYFSQTLNLFRLNAQSQECEITASSAYNLFSGDSIVKVVSSGEKNGRADIIAAEFNLKENAVILNEFDRDRLTLKRSAIVNTGGAVDDFIPYAGEKNLLVIAAKEGLARIIKSGYFYDAESCLTLDSFYAANAASPFPAKLEKAGDTAFWAAHNRIYVIDLIGKKVATTLKAAR